jgi:hypothetical protein
MQPVEASVVVPLSPKETWYFTFGGPRRAVEHFADIVAVEDYRRGITMTADDAKLFLFRTRRAEPQAAQRGFCGLFRDPPSIDYISFLVADVDRTYAELARKGIAFEVEPSDQDWGPGWRPSRIPTGTTCTSCVGSAGSLLRGQPLPAKLPQRVFRLSQMPKPHAVEHFGRLGELYLGVLDDLPVVAPRVQEVYAPAR